MDARKQRIELIRNYSDRNFFGLILIPFDSGLNGIP
jgi:hypothetical protein